VERDVVSAVTGTPTESTLGSQLIGKHSLTARCNGQRILLLAKAAEIFNDVHLSTYLEHHSVEAISDESLRRQKVFDAEGHVEEGPSASVTPASRSTSISGAQ